ncbi:MAG: hypothetical protein JNK87_22425 [Bryobacterales bacterium]|nr:hypothetical protein [Bryobacterales bacterium]
MRYPWALVCLSIGAPAADVAGPAACQPCHPTQYVTQTRSHHALALRRIIDTPVPELLAAQPLRERSGVDFRYELTRQGLNVTTTLGPETATGLLIWAFGSGAQASTPVGRIGNTWFEHRVSYYAEVKAGRLTMGHPAAASTTASAALGLAQQPEVVTQCFQCHATGVQPGPNLRDMVPGVTCERCHGEAKAHLRSANAIKPAPRTQAAITALCASCHRLPGSLPDATPEITDPLSIRYAPVGLLASACYRGSSALTCTNCHNPHGNATRNPAFYEAKCRSCHSTGTKPCKAGNTGGCLDCHMQQRSPAPYLRFTDHRIRVYRSE